VQESNVAGTIWKKEESIYLFLPFPVDRFYDSPIFPADGSVFIGSQPLQ